MNTRIERRTICPLIAAFLVVFLASCGVNMMPTRDVWFTQHYIIMQDFERSAYRTFSEAGRQGFHDLFWKHRSPEAHDMFLARMEYVKKTFWKENSQQPWNTDRGRTYLLNGSPANIEFDQNINFTSANLPGQSGDAADRAGEDIQANRAEVWTYQHAENRVRYIFIFVRPSNWRIYQSAMTNTRYLGDLENYSKTVNFGINDKPAYEQEIAGLEKKK